MSQKISKILNCLLGLDAICAIFPRPRELLPRTASRNRSLVCLRTDDPNKHQQTELKTKVHLGIVSSLSHLYVSIDGGAATPVGPSSPLGQVVEAGTPNNAGRTCKKRFEKKLWNVLCAVLRFGTFAGVRSDSDTHRTEVTSTVGDPTERGTQRLRERPTSVWSASIVMEESGDDDVGPVAHLLSATRCQCTKKRTNSPTHDRKPKPAQTLSAFRGLLESTRSVTSYTLSVSNG